MKRRSKVPKYIERGEGETPKGHFPKGESSLQPMNFKKANARKWRPAQNKGRGHPGGWADLKYKRA